MAMGKIRIEPLENAFGKFRVYLNDEDISHYVRRVSVDMGVGLMPTAVVEFICEVETGDIEAAVEVAKQYRGERIGAAEEE